MDVATNISGESYGEVQANNEMLVIDVSPEILNCSDAMKDLSDRQLLREYTRDENKRFLENTDRIYYSPSANLDRPNLFSDFHKAGKREPGTFETSKFSNKWLLHYLDHNQQLLQNQPHFVCAFSTLRLLMCACYESEWMQYAKKSGWKIYCKKVNGIWYLSETWSDYADGAYYNVKYASRMFELLNTETSSLEMAAEAAKSYLRQRKTYQLFLTKLGEHRLLYSGNVHCFDKSGCAVQLKTTTKWGYDLSGKKRLDQPALRMIWAQAHLMGTKKVVIGYLKRYGKDTMILEGTEEVDSESIGPDTSATWQTEVCIACLERILHIVKSDAFFQDKETTYELRYDKKENKIMASKTPIEFPVKQCTQRASNE